MSARALTVLGLINTVLVVVAIAADSRATFALAAVGGIGTLVLVARKGSAR